MTPAPARTSLEFAALTDIGQVRRHNEDAIAVSEACTGCGFALLADGMGGHLAGEVASGMAVTIIQQALESILLNHANTAPAEVRQQLHGWMRDAIVLANIRILQSAHSQIGCRGMGTTLVLALQYENTLSVAHVGDSRLYLLRGRMLQQLTRDHSLLQEQIAAGLIKPDEAALSNRRNIITRALGVGPLVEIELHDHDVQPGDIALLCSDGLTEMVSDSQIADLLHANRFSLPHACAQLVAYANACGGQDNISVVLMKIRENHD